MKRKWIVRILAILLVIAMVVGSAWYLIEIIAPAKVNVYAMSADDREKLDNLEDLFKLVKENYRDQVDDRMLIEGAYAGVLASLDPWSVYYSSSEEMEEFTSSLESEQYGGIGCTIVAKDGKIYVSDLNRVGPAYRYGLKIGDNIVAVDGVKFAGDDIDAAAKKMRGEAGTKVKITVIRQGKPLDFTFVRKVLNKSSVTTTLYELSSGKALTSVAQIDEKKGNLAGVIHISQFDEGCAKEFEKQLILLEGIGVKKIVIDLRDNPGGYMDEALDCACCFLKQGDKLISYIHQGETIGSNFVQVGDEKKFDVVILVNQESASASEAFTLIMKDYNLAKVVGVTTFGKGVAQEIFPLGDGSYIKLTTCYYAGPKNNTLIEGKGISPDVYATCDGKSLTEIKILGLADTQLKKAIELLK